MIVFVHLLNDRSGSPRVLCSAINALQPSRGRAHLFVGSEGAGCLDDVPVPITRYFYWRSRYRFLTFLVYLLSQLVLVWKLLRFRDVDKNSVIYINTLLPFGAAIYGLITGTPVIYHLHEVSLRPKIFKWFLVAVARLCAKRLIYVSNFHRECLGISNVSSKTVYNALPDEFFAMAGVCRYRHRRDGYFTVLMLASLRDYKGVPEFLDLAGKVEYREDIRFVLVLNDDDASIRRYFSSKIISKNVAVHSRADDPAIFYSTASLVLNLSRPDLWVETFGLTVLEAMAFGIPVIAPPIGGPVELICHGTEGFLIDSRCSEQLKQQVLALADDEGLCMRISISCRSKAAFFSTVKFSDSLRDAVDIRS